MSVKTCPIGFTSIHKELPFDSQRFLGALPPVKSQLLVLATFLLPVASYVREQPVIFVHSSHQVKHKRGLNAAGSS